MKIKVIDLLVKYANRELTHIKTKYNNYLVNKWDEEDFLYDVYKEFSDRNNDEIIEFLNDYVEIIEEPKKTEKMARCDDVKMTHYNELYEPTENEEILMNKINELIDEINNLKENKYE